MAKIENKVAYPLVTPQANDYIVLTDVSDNNETKTCKIGDLISFNGWTVFQRTLTASELQNSFNNPVILIPAAGPNKIVMPMGYNCLFKMNTNTAAFNFGSDAFITTAPGTAGLTPIYTLSQTLLNQPTFPVEEIFSTSSFNTQEWLPYVNSPIIFYSTTPPTLGDGSLTINFQYRIITF